MALPPPTSSLASVCRSSAEMPFSSISRTTQSSACSSPPLKLASCSSIVMGGCGCCRSATDEQSLTCSPLQRCLAELMQAVGPAGTRGHGRMPCRQAMQYSAS
jgi:hypothetical protein